MIKIIYVFILFFIFTSKNKNINNSSKISDISIQNKIVIKEKEVNFFYSVSPIIYNDEILINSSYVLGNDNYYSPVLDNSITIKHDKENQHINIKCNFPFDKRIIVKVFSAKNNNIFTKIILDYKQKFELINCDLLLDSDNNYFYLKPELDITLGSIKIEREVKYKSIEFDADYISDVKKQMLNESERLIYNRTHSNDIVFKHNFSGFETSDAINLFSKNDNKVFSSFSNKVEYSYFDYSNNVLINDVQTYNVYDLLKNEFFYQNRTIFKVVFSIDNKSYNMEFSLWKSILNIH